MDDGNGQWKWTMEMNNKWTMEMDDGNGRWKWTMKWTMEMDDGNGQWKWIQWGCMCETWNERGGQNVRMKWWHCQALKHDTNT